MKNKKCNYLPAFLKWAALLAVVFALSVPWMSRNCQASANTYMVSVPSGYLALRTQMLYDSRNEIGQLYNGDTVQVNDTSDPTYWLVYSPKYNLNGFVNKDYLVGDSMYTGAVASSDFTRTVSVSNGYLALRNAKAYDSSNEIGKLNNGETVQVIDSSDPSYWYVYSSSLMKYGYVNKDYLY